MNFFNVEILGWLAALCFGLSPLFQVIKCYKEKHATGVSLGLLIMWTLGEIFSILYILPKGHLPLLANYTINMIFIVIIIYYKIKGHRNGKR